MHQAFIAPESLIFLFKFYQVFDFYAFFTLFQKFKASFYCLFSLVFVNNKDSVFC